MSNVWYYQILVPLRPALSEGDLAEAARSMEACGFSVGAPKVHPPGATAWQWTAPHGGQPDAVQAGGWSSKVTVSGRRGEDVISVSFDPRGQEQARRIHSGIFQDVVGFGEICISVDDCQYRYPSEGWRLARAVEALFAELCTKQGGAYGYSADEEALERYMRGMHAHDDALRWLKPSVLFWLNYYRTEYLTRIGGPEVFRQVGATLTDLAQGVLVSFFRYPWRVDHRRLCAINEAWRALR